MTEPRADDPGALVAEVRGVHIACDNGTCFACTTIWSDDNVDAVPYPCQLVRLADALERELADETLNDYVVALGLEFEAVMKERDAARAEAAALRERVTELERSKGSLDDRFERALSILSEFVSDKPCGRINARGDCQVHGWLGSRPCPQARIKDFRLIRGSADQDVIVPGYGPPPALAPPEPRHD